MDRFADDAVHFDDAFLMDQVEDGLAGDGVGDGFAGNVVIRVEESDDGVDLACGEGDDEIDGAGHAGLGVVVYRHGPGQHGGDPGTVETLGNVAHDIELVLHWWLHSLRHFNAEQPEAALYGARGEPAQGKA